MEANVTTLFQFFQKTQTMFLFEFLPSRMYNIAMACVRVYLGLYPAIA